MSEGAFDLVVFDSEVFDTPPPIEHGCVHISLAVPTIELSLTTPRVDLALRDCS